MTTRSFRCVLLPGGGVSELVIPQKMNVLDVFKDTLHMLYHFKQHNVNLLDKLKPAIERRAVKEQLKMMTGGHEEAPTRSAPKTFFTSKRKRERKN